MTIARSSSKRQTAASSGSRRPTNRSGNDAGSKISLTGRSTCVSASALSLDAQPAQVESVVRRISRPVCGIGIYLLDKNDQQPFLVAGHFTPVTNSNYGVVVIAGVSGEPGKGRMNWLPLGMNIVCTPGESFKIDRKSTRLNSSHGYISYAVFCLKKKKKNDNNQNEQS